MSPQWLRRLHSPVSEMEVERAARQAAGASFRDICQRVGPAMARMNSNEANGYLRARARRPVARHVAALLPNDQRFDSEVRRRIIEKSINHTVRILARQMVLQTAPALRRAA